MKYSVHIAAVGAFLWLITAASCGSKTAVYQKQQAIPGAKWAAKFQPLFKIEIKDTTVAYPVWFLVRHDESYPYSNIWVRMKVKAPGDTVFRDGPRIELELADSKGEWQGRGMGGIWEEKVPVRRKDAPQFSKPGLYEIKVEQLMRNDPLPAMLNIGLEIGQLAPLRK